MCNFDSCGSAMGWNSFYTNVNDGLCQQIHDVFGKHDVWYQECRKPEPTNDLFPFTVVSIPGITLLRKNCESGVFYHHRFDNTIDVIAADMVANLAEAALDLTEPMADGMTEYEISVDDTKKDEVQQSWMSIFGGWKK